MITHPGDALGELLFKLGVAELLAELAELGRGDNLVRVALEPIQGDGGLFVGDFGNPVDGSEDDDEDCDDRADRSFLL